MEGVVWKWTNYWTGWQPRWFVLKDGALSYYKSREEVSQSCKGSIKMSACEIIVHTTDANRVDLVIPSEQHFYLRLATPQERQQWLVALGSSKATSGARIKKSLLLLSSSSSSSSTSAIIKTFNNSRQPSEHSSSSPSSLSLSPPAGSPSSPSDLLKSKTSELRLYCDLLMQQVHAVKTAAAAAAPASIPVDDDDGNDKSLLSGAADVDAALDDASSLLGATCDTFIKTLEECMIVSNLAHNLRGDVNGRTSSSSSSSSPNRIESASSASASENNSSALMSDERPFQKKVRAGRKSPKSGDRSSEPGEPTKWQSRQSEDNGHQNENENQMADEQKLRRSVAMGDRRTDFDDSSTENEATDDNGDDDDERTTAGNCTDEFEDAQETHDTLDNVFGDVRMDATTTTTTSKLAETKSNGTNEDLTSDAIQCSPRKSLIGLGDLELNPAPGIRTFFSNLEVSFLNMKLAKDGGIPTKHFLESCAIVITIFEMFGSPIFTPMKLDVNGNLKKINDKYNTNCVHFTTLQNIVRHEMDTGTEFAKNSATDAIMWLKRGLEFTREFLQDFQRANVDLKLCALNAYNRTLKQYHGWIVRNVISTAMRTVPSRDEVLLKLALRPDDVRDPCYERELVSDARRFTTAMNAIIKILNDFYYRHNLEPREIG